MSAESRHGREPVMRKKEMRIEYWSHSSLMGIELQNVSE
jgi:hypothetical protein